MMRAALWRGTAQQQFGGSWRDPRDSAQRDLSALLRPDHELRRGLEGGAFAEPRRPTQLDGCLANSTYQPATRNTSSYEQFSGGSSAPKKCSSISSLEPPRSVTGAANDRSPCATEDAPPG